MAKAPKYSIEKAFNNYGSEHIINELSYLVGKALNKFNVSNKEKENVKRSLMIDFKKFLDYHV
jgi:hypothetical protein